MLAATGRLCEQAMSRHLAEPEQGRQRGGRVEGRDELLRVLTLSIIKEKGEEGGKRGGVGQ